MKETAFCMCENKGTDQLHGYSAFFRYTHYFIILCGCLEPDLCRTYSKNTEDRVSRDPAHMV